MQIVHEGRGGYVELAGHRFNIEHVDAGHFCISLPRGVQVAPELMDALKVFAAAQDPSWYVED
ncbi:hypothetical protein HSX11_00365 [Oxalobacteraceae bacterium]|nr:hypothetical protein [Oxalobacteraceae bacterium]